MSWVRKKPVRIAAIVVAVLLLAVVAVKLLLPAEKIRDLALAEARERLGRDVSVGAVSVSLRGGLGVRLADFAIANPAGFVGDDLLRTKALDLKLALGPLFKGQVQVDRLVIEAPAVNLVRRADGSDNFTFAAPAESAPGAGSGGGGQAAPPPLTVASLTLRDGQLVFTDETAPAAAVQSVRVSDVSLGLSLANPVPGSYRVNGRLAAGDIAVSGPAALPGLDAQADFEVTWTAETSALDLTKVALDVSGVPMMATGQVVVAGAAPTGMIRLQLTAVPVVALASFMPPELGPGLKGDRNSGTVSATVNLALVGAGKPPVQITGTAAINELDLTLLQPFLPPSQPGRLAGRAELELEFSDRTGDPAGIDYTGVARVRQASFTESGLVDDLLELDASLRFTPTELALQSCRARFGAGTFTLTGRLRDPFPYFLPPEMQGAAEMKTPQLGFELRTARLDVDRLLPVASPATEAPGGPASTRAATIPDDLEFPDLTCDGTFTADTLIYLQVPLTAVRGTVTLRNRQLRVHQVTATVYQGQLAGDVAIDLNNLQDPAYAGNYQATGIEVDDFVSRFAGLGGVLFGRCNLKGDFAARGLEPETIRDGLTLNADAGLAEGRFVTTGNVHQALSKVAAQAGQTLSPEQSLRDLATHISVKQGRVYLNALTTRLGQFGDVTVDGYYGFNGDLAYQGSLLLTESQTDQLFSSGVMAELAKLLGSQRPQRLELPLSVGGSRTEPKVRLDLGAVTSDLQARAAREQGDKLEDEARRKLGDLLNKWR